MVLAALGSQPGTAQPIRPPAALFVPAIPAVADRDLAAAAVREFLTTPVGWYFHLVLTASEHARVSLSQVKVPAAFVAASYDVMAGAPYMRTAAERLEGATYVELLGSHFIQLERPDEVHALLLEFLQRVD